MRFYIEYYQACEIEANTVSEAKEIWATQPEKRELLPSYDPGNILVVHSI